MPHIIARNDHYPQYSFCVPALRPFLKRKGRLDKESTVVKFIDRVLDTKAQGYTEGEADAIQKQLSALIDTHVTLDFGDDQTSERGVEVKVSSQPLPLKMKGD